MNILRIFGRLFRMSSLILCRGNSLHQRNQDVSGRRRIRVRKISDRIIQCMHTSLDASRFLKCGLLQSCILQMFGLSVLDDVVARRLAYLLMTHVD